MGYTWATTSKCACSPVASAIATITGAPGFLENQPGLIINSALTLLVGRQEEQPACKKI